MLFLVAYDLKLPGRNYLALYGALNALGATSLQGSVWAVRHNTAVALRDYLWRFMDPSDRLVVVGVEDTTWATMNTVHLDAV